MDTSVRRKSWITGTVLWATLGLMAGCNSSGANGSGNPTGMGATPSAAADQRTDNPKAVPDGGAGGTGTAGAGAGAAGK